MYHAGSALEVAELWNERSGESLKASSSSAPRAVGEEEEEEIHDEEGPRQGILVPPIKALSINSDSCGADSCLECSEEEEEELDECPSLDQRHLNLVHEELEKLNIATDVINKLEVQLDGARENFREAQNHWSDRLKELSKKYGTAIAKARPYYEAKLQERRLREESQRAAIRFERASNLLAVAKEQVSLTQDSLNRQTTVHPECLEVLNHHIQRVSEAEAERLAAEIAHKKLAEKMLLTAAQISSMEKEHRAAIKKSRSYFDQRLEFSRVLDRQKALIMQLESEVRQKKSDYTTSLRNLERISDSIHEQRSLGGTSNRSAPRAPPAQGPTTSQPATTALGAESTPDCPPPYRPTAPPAYDAHGFSLEAAPVRLVMTPPEEQDEAAVMSLFSGEDGEEGKRRSLGSGVILLAQQLMGGAKEENNRYDLGGSETDVSYRTSLPSSAAPMAGSMSASSAESSEVSSLASARLVDDDKLLGMLRSHSLIISEIEGAADRVEYMLKRSVSDADPESGVESTSG